MCCKLVLGCDELHDDIERSLTSIPDLLGAIMTHIHHAPANRERCSESHSTSQLWSNARVRPLGKFYFGRSDAGESISYHVPAAQSIEIQFASRMAVSAAIKVLCLSFAPPLSFHLQSQRLPRAPTSFGAAGSCRLPPQAPLHCHASAVAPRICLADATGQLENFSREHGCIGSCPAIGRAFSY